MLCPEFNEKLENCTPPDEGLRPFQQTTVRHVIKQLATNGSRKFLVADEVGLGKTKVAKGVIKTFLDILTPGGATPEQPLTVLYLCANQQLAWQNLKSFHFFEAKDELVRSDLRLSLLAWSKMTDKEMKCNNKKIHLFALTPGTSFEIASGSGTMDERALITVLLDKDGTDREFQDAMKKYSPPPKKIENEDASSWERKKKSFYEKQNLLNVPIFRILRDRMLGILNTDSEYSDFVNFYRQKCKDAFPEMQAACSESDPIKNLRNCFIAYGKQDEKTHNSWRKDKEHYHGAPLSFMRQIMAKLGITEIKPDLIIMDEFQRYDQLLFKKDKDSEEGLFSLLVKECENQDPKPYFLLLSATPYATFASNNEQVGKDIGAHSGLIRLLNWLADKGKNPEKVPDFENLRSSYFDHLEHADEDKLRIAKNAFEETVMKYMCRTERRTLKKTESVEEEKHRDFPDSLWKDGSRNLYEYAANEVLCYQKAYHDSKSCYGKWNQLLNMAKYSTKPLSFMKHYQLQADFMAMKSLFFENEQALKNCNDSRISQLKKILGPVFEKKLLWIPPTNPSRQLAGDFANSEGTSKVLIFSSWRFVPRMLSLVLSAQFEEGKRDFAAERPDNPSDQMPILFWGQSPWHPAQALTSAIKKYFDLKQETVTDIVNKFIPEFGSRIFWHRQLNLKNQDGFHFTKKMIDYCHDGCLEDVFDEYIYMIRGQLGNDKDLDGLKGYLSTQNVRIPSILEVTFTKGSEKHIKYMSDCFGEKDRKNKNTDSNAESEPDDQGGSMANLQRAFNSPFAPFLLSTTSIGQEGLDFHWYCRKIVHWNIPDNPIELEQRNGRIDRFHSLSVRQSIVNGLKKSADDENRILNKNWFDIFKTAENKWKDQYGLSPDWYIENPECPIEQYAYYLPFSQDEDELRLVCFQSGYYRSILGQPNFQEFQKTCANTDLLKKYPLSFQPHEEKIL